MQNGITYIQDNSGTIEAVKVPIKVWNNLQNQIKKQKQLLNLKRDLTQALKEVGEMQNGNRKEVTLAEFLNEL